MIFSDILYKLVLLETVTLQLLQPAPVLRLLVKIHTNPSH